MNKPGLRKGTATANSLTKAAIGAAALVITALAPLSLAAQTSPADSPTANQTPFEINSTWQKASREVRQGT